MGYLLQEVVRKVSWPGDYETWSQVYHQLSVIISEHLLFYGSQFPCLKKKAYE